MVSGFFGWTFGRNRIYKYCGLWRKRAWWGMDGRVIHKNTGINAGCGIFFVYFSKKRSVFYFSCGNDFTLPEKFDIISIYGIFWVLSGSDRFMGDSGLRGQGPLAAPGVFPSPFSFVYSIVSYDDPMESGSISCSLFKRPGKPAVFRFPDTGCGMCPGMLRQSGVGTFFCDYSAMGLRKKKRSK